MSEQTKPQEASVQRIVLSVMLEIVPDGTQRMGVSGPTDNPLLCYGMLEEAKNIIRENQAKAAKKSSLVIAHTV
jgi:hypothetical protein